MRRYRKLNKNEVLEAFNRLGDAFLAARNGNDVNKITDGLLTYDEKLKIGRRILIAEYLVAGLTVRQVTADLKVGLNTVMHISRRLEKYKECFDLIKRRHRIVESQYQDKKYKLVGASTLVYKRKEYTGFKRRDVKRK